VKKTGSSLLSVLFITVGLLFFTGCEDKQEGNAPIAVENTTEILASPEVPPQQKKREEENRTAPSADNDAGLTLTLTDSGQQKHTLTFRDDDTIVLQELPQTVVVLNFFATWCPPCRAEIPYLSDLQKKYKNKILVAGILVNDLPEKEALETFVRTYRLDYPVSTTQAGETLVSNIVKTLHLSKNFSIPLTIIYKNGSYFTHYEGTVPIEMIDHDVQDALKPSR
jgi:thiol-disulfide isomerase/thioredoxin